MELIADMSTAPEIARLAEAVPLLPTQAHGQDQAQGQDHGQAHGQDQGQDQPERKHRLTLGTLAGRLRMIAAAPERWWALVRFDPDRPVRISVDHDQAYEAWLMILPPGDAGQSCDCDVVTMIAGEATEGAHGGNALRPGPIRVHGQRHWLRGHGAGYTVSLHARARRP